MESGIATLHGRRVNQSILNWSRSTFVGDAGIRHDKPLIGNVTTDTNKHGALQDLQKGNKWIMMENGKRRGREWKRREGKAIVQLSSYSYLHAVLIILVVLTTVRIWQRTASLAATASSFSSSKTTSPTNVGRFYPLHQPDDLIMTNVIALSSEKQTEQYSNRQHHHSDTKKHEKEQETKKSSRKDQHHDEIALRSDETISHIFSLFWILPENRRTDYSSKTQLAPSSRVENDSFTFKHSQPESQ